MTHPHHDRNNVLHQAREGEHRDEPLAPPVPGEVIGGRSTPPYKARGLDALSPLLDSIQFPATREEVMARIGDAVIALDSYNTTLISEIVRRTGAQTFRSSHELEDAAARVLRDMRPHHEGGRGAHHRQDDNVTGRPRRG